MVLVDCPPVLAVSDPVVISSFCDGVLFVVSQLRTERKMAKEAIKVLKNGNANILGVVFTEIQTKEGLHKNPYYNYNYYYYGDNKKSKNK